MKLSGLHLLLSYQCTYECDHCFVHSSPKARGTMTLEFVRDAIKQAAELDTIEEIYFEGGEPFLFYPILVESVRYAASMGQNVGIVTNGYFATSVDDAIEYLRPLQTAVREKNNRGTLYISVSQDELHGNKGKDSPAARTLAAARQLGIDCDSIAIGEPCVIERQKGDPIVGGDVRFRGRAADTLGLNLNLPRRPWYEFTECPDEDFHNVGRLHLDGYGNLYACQGIVIGNLHKQPLRDIVQHYNPESHPIIAPLIKGGPAELVRQYDLPLKLEYLDACELCYRSRQLLRHRFPSELAPEVVYGENADSD